MATARRALATWTARRRAHAPPGRAARAVAVGAWGYLGLVVLFAAVMWGLGDRAWPGTVLLFMGRWVLLLPLAVLVPAALLARRAALLPLLLATLVALGPVMGGRTGWRTWLGAPSAGMPFRVVTLNAGGERGASPVLAILLPDVLLEWAPDVVAFQECGGSLQRAVRTMPDWSHHVSDGLCLLSRHPIEAAVVMDRTALDRHRQLSGGIGGAGFVVHYTLRTPGGPIGLTNLHLETPRRGLEGLWSADLDRLRVNTMVRDIESRMARRWVDRGRGPGLVVGDFNTPVESRIFREHWGDLTNAFSHAGAGFGMTKHNGWIRARIDHVLAGDGWEVRSAVVGRDLASDHLPLVVDLVLAGR